MCNWASILEIDPTFGVSVSESDSPPFGVDISRLLRFKATWSNRISNMAMVSWGAHNTGRWSVRDDLFHGLFFNVFSFGAFSCKDGEEVRWENHFLWKRSRKNLTKRIKFQSKAHSTTPFSLQPEVNLMAGSRHEKVGQRFGNVFQFYALEN